MDHLHEHLPKHQSSSQSLTVGPAPANIYKNIELHPTHTMQERIIIDGERQQLQQLSVLYGSHMPMRMVIERNILAGTRRLGGHGSSMFGLNMAMDRYDELDFFDILNDPYEAPMGDREGIRERLEKEYAL